jgi:hypothetical protein
MMGGVQSQYGLGRRRRKIKGYCPFEVQFLKARINGIYRGSDAANRFKDITQQEAEGNYVKHLNETIAF